MAAIQNGWQHDIWQKMTINGPLHPNWIFPMFGSIKFHVGTNKFLGENQA